MDSDPVKERYWNQINLNATKNIGLKIQFFSLLLKQSKPPTIYGVVLDCFNTCGFLNFWVVVPNKWQILQVFAWPGWHLPDNCLMTPWQLFDDCITLKWTLNHSKIDFTYNGYNKNNNKNYRFTRLIEAARSLKINFLLLAV